VLNGKKWSQEFLAVALLESLKAIFGIAAATVTLYLLTLSKTKWALMINSHHVSMGAVGGAVATLLISNAYHRIRYYPSLPKQSHNFSQVERELTFVYLSATKFTYKKRIVLKALHNGLDSYTDKYKWTGSVAPIKIASAIPEHTLRMTERKSVWQYYDICFEKTLAKKETIETELVFDLEDPNDDYTPFISATILEPTNKLTFRLTIPPSMGITVSTCETSRSMGARVPYESETKHFDRNGNIVWEIDKPKMHHHYELRWRKPGR